MTSKEPLIGDMRNIFCCKVLLLSDMTMENRADQETVISVIRENGIQLLE
jgi:hypothetical protein